MDNKKKEILNSVAKMVSSSLAEASPYLLTELAYKKVFYHHTYSEPYNRFDNELFPNLESSRIEFKSNENRLVGYFYNYKNVDKSKLIIFVHGFGNGHHRYLDIINYLAQNGFYVFSYDQTSFDESSGEGIYGFPNGLIDLENAINFIKKTTKYKEEDIILIGHSWGAYCVGAILNIFPRIDKAIMLSGFDKSTALIREHGYEWAGQKVDENIKYIDEYESFRFGKYASLSVTSGIKNSNSKMFIVHSSDDKVVPISIGLDLYKNQFNDSSRFIFIRYTDRGHGCVYYSLEGKSYYEDLIARYKKYLKSVNNVTNKDKDNLFNLIVDKSRYIDLLNYSLLDSIINFINE